MINKPYEIFTDKFHDFIESKLPNESFLIKKYKYVLDNIMVSTENIISESKVYLFEDIKSLYQYVIEESLTTEGITIDNFAYIEIQLDTNLSYYIDPDNWNFIDIKEVSKHIIVTE